MWRKKQRILVVDDDPVIHRIVRNWCEKKLGVDVRGCGSVEEAIVQADKEKPDLVVLDWHLPGADGLHFLRWLRRSRTLGTVPVIMVTCNQVMGSIEEAFAAGANGYLVKPLNLGKLADFVRDGV